MEAIEPTAETIPASSVLYEEAYKNWSEGLSQKTLGVLDDWSKRAFADIRKVDALSTAARQVLTDKKLIAASKKLGVIEKALTEAPNFTGELQRGLSYIPREEALNKFAQGRSFDLDALSSWTKSSDKVLEFAHGGMIPSEYLDSSFFGTGKKTDTVGIVLKTRIEKPGAVDISGVMDSVYSRTESEVVVKKGKSFKIASVLPLTDGTKLFVDLIEE